MTRKIEYAPGCPFRRRSLYNHNFNLLNLYNGVSGNYRTNMLLETSAKINFNRKLSATIIQSSQDVNKLFSGTRTAYKRLKVSTKQGKGQKKKKRPEITFVYFSIRKLPSV